jgi:hypothetical protein
MASLENVSATGEKLSATSDKSGSTSHPPMGLSVGEAACSLEVVVLHTDIRETLEALKAAANLAQGLAARIRLLVPQIVPASMPMDRPELPLGHAWRRFQTLASGTKIKTYVDIRRGRDKNEILESVLKPGSVVVLGGKRPRWPGKVGFLAHRLEKMGHHVVFAGTR